MIKSSQIQSKLNPNHKINFKIKFKMNEGKITIMKKKKTLMKSNKIVLFMQ